MVEQKQERVVDDVGNNNLNRLNMTVTGESNSNQLSTSDNYDDDVDDAKFRVVR